ncbi:hypothetical protein BC629DRAFT_1010681 [Irpex lacteus]|nr:hypothetical protein BC629DRAFT_1010681 [Irpex lacteus]
MRNIQTCSDHNSWRKSNYCQLFLLIFAAFSSSLNVALTSSLQLSFLSLGFASVPYQHRISNGLLDCFDFCTFMLVVRSLYEYYTHISMQLPMCASSRMTER